MLFKLSKVSGRNLGIWRALNSLLPLAILLLSPYRSHLLPSFILTSGLRFYLFAVVLFLIILSYMLYFYAYNKSRKMFPKDNAFKIPLPVTNKKMKVLWISMNLLGLAFILLAVLVKLQYPFVIILFLLGGISMRLSIAFKRQAYKNIKYQETA